jgi:quercetin dioxygenase-like cupin family protein
MAWGESKAWLTGKESKPLYQSLLDDATEAPTRNAKRKKVVTPEDMPWEMSRQGLLKHLINEQMNTRMETVDAYMQIIPPDSRSGKHRHLAEECVYVLEGRGYDLHQDCDVEITDVYFWKPQDEVKRFEYEAGDLVYIPPNTIHQRRPGPAAAADLGDQPHLQANRPQRPRADRRRAGIRSERDTHGGEGARIHPRKAEGAGVNLVIPGHTEGASPEPTTGLWRSSLFVGSGFLD